MAKKKKTTVTEYMDAMKHDKAETEHAKSYKIGETELSFVIKENLTLEERASMIRDIVGMVFLSDEDGLEHYCPYLKTFALFYNIVSYFTDIPLPHASEKAWEFCNQTPIIQDVFDVVGPKPIRLIEQDANAMIEFKKEQVLRQSKFDSILQGFEKLVKDVQAKVDGLSEDGVTELVKKYAPGLEVELQKVLQEKSAEVAGN